MFFAAPGGLNLYWLASNLCAIVQQGLTLRMLESQDERRPASENEADMKDQVFDGRDGGGRGGGGVARAGHSRRTRCATWCWTRARWPPGA